ncbi:MAG: hypothetical protein ACK5LC_16685 [Coprobacillaceae bacterium]
MNKYEYVIPPVRELTYPIRFLLMTYPTELTTKEYDTIYDSILKIVYEIDEI